MKEHLVLSLTKRRDFGSLCLSVLIHPCSEPPTLRVNQGSVASGQSTLAFVRIRIVDFQLFLALDNSKDLDPAALLGSEYGMGCGLDLLADCVI